MPRGSGQDHSHMHTPRTATENDRRDKLTRLVEAGIDPYPHAYSGVVTSEKIRAELEEWIDPGQGSGQDRRVAGRIQAIRKHGKNSFIDLVDGTGKIQLHARVDLLGDDNYKTLCDLDSGDLIGGTGEVVKSKRGELSVRLNEWTFLAKALAAPPDKVEGLKDTETRYRQRELDLMANQETKDRFILRSKTISAMRNYLDGKGFIEVETPVLQPIYGGALARPFSAHHNQTDQELFLRIATELYLKRLIVGGLDKVYEIGRNFRNEGISHKHNPEFTMIEMYAAYEDYNDIAKRFEDMVYELSKQVDYQGPINFKTPWARKDLLGAIKEATGLDTDKVRDPLELHRQAAEKGIELDPNDSWSRQVDELFSKHVEPSVTDPVIFTDYPVEMSPFAKKHRSREGFVERFECCIGGMEIANAFSELNDPADQIARFEEAAKQREAGDDEAQQYDEEFIRALEHGMPPTGGIGIGIDRLVMLFSGQDSIREVVLWPAMKKKLQD